MRLTTEASHSTCCMQRPPDAGGTAEEALPVSAMEGEGFEAEMVAFVCLECESRNEVERCDEALVCEVCGEEHFPSAAQGK